MCRINRGGRCVDGSQQVPPLTQGWPPLKIWSNIQISNNQSFFTLQHFTFVMGTYEIYHYSLYIHSINLQSTARLMRKSGKALGRSNVGPRHNLWGNSRYSKIVSRNFMTKVWVRDLDISIFYYDIKRIKNHKKMSPIFFGGRNNFETLPP